MSLNAPPPPYSQQTPANDSLRHSTETPVAESVATASPQTTQITQVTQDSLGRYFSSNTAGSEKILIIETDLYVAEVTTHGGLIRKWLLKDYKTWDQQPVQLVEFEAGGDFSLLFTSSDGKLINTRSLSFHANFSPWQRIVLARTDTYRLDFSFMTTNGGIIKKTLTFAGNSYSFDVDIAMEKMEDVISGYEYQVVWENGLRYTEHNSVDESSFAAAYAYAGKELAEIDAAKHAEPEHSDISGTTGWVATRTKYFATAILPKNTETQGAYIGGVAHKMPDNGTRESYTIGLRIPYRGNQDREAHFIVFLGPLDFDIIKSFHADLDQIMSLGATWVIRPIAEWVMIPLFQLLRAIIPNYGIVIVVFSIIIKLALYPLTKSSMKSMKKMQALQPMMEEIREKYKEDPQKMNRQIMQLYKEYGVNPAGGCLPMLLQLPILYALWAVFRSAIELRQASFVWWINDLSIPDVITKLPFHIPIFGIQEISGLALLMGITMFIQQKMTVKDPRQKMMVWMMPVMLTLLFNSFPAGLNLYYFVFNLLSIGQQFWVNKQQGDGPPRKVEVKKKAGGFMNRLTKDLPKLKR